jgi:hypothetical protein
MLRCLDNYCNWKALHLVFCSAAVGRFAQKLVCPTRNEPGESPAKAACPAFNGVAPSSTVTKTAKAPNLCIQWLAFVLRSTRTARHDLLVFIFFAGSP